MRLLRLAAALPLSAAVVLTSSQAAFASPPVAHAVTAISVLLPTLDQTHGDVSQGFDVHISGGVQSVTMDALGPEGASLPEAVCCFASVNGSDEWRTLDPGFGTIGQAGTWTVTDVRWTDSDGNAHTQTSLPGGNPSFTVTKAADTTGPTVTSVVATPATVDVAHGAAYEAVTVLTADAVAGASYVDVTVTGPGGYTDEHAVRLPYADHYGPVTGRSFVIGFTVPEGAKPGTYTATVANLSDAQGNYATGSPSTTFMVAAHPAAAAPVLASLGVSPSSVTTSTGPAQVVVAVRATSTAGRVTGGDLTLTDAAGTSVPTTTTTFGDDRRQSTSTERDVTWLVPVTIPAQSSAGAWHVGAVHLAEAFGGTAALTRGGSGSASSSVLDGASAITVSRTVDTAAPAVAGVEVQSGAAGNAGPWVRAHVTDDVSGPAAGSVVATFSQSGSSTGPLPVTLVRVAGSATDGTWVGRPGFGLFDPAATLTLTALTATDQAGHVTSAASSQLGQVIPPAGAPTAGGQPQITAVAPVRSAFDVVADVGVPVLTVDASDSGSAGVQGIDATLVSADHRSSITLATQPDNDDLSLPVSGTTSAGRFALMLGEGQQAVVPGTYHLASLVVSDDYPGYGSGHTYTGTRLGQVTGAGLTFTVTDPRTPGTGAPSVTGSSLEPSTLVSSDTPVPVRLRLTLDPNAPPATYSTALLVNQATGQSIFLSGGDCCGGSTFGSLVLRGDLPAGASTGTWTVEQLEVGSGIVGLGVPRTYTSATLPGAPDHLTVTGAPDTTAPDVRQLTLAPLTSADGAAEERVSIEVTDAGTGIRDFSSANELTSVLITTPSAPSYSEPGLPLGGTAQDAWVASDLFLTSRPQPLVITVQDRAGNTRTLRTADLAARGLPTTLPALPSVPDLRGPTLTAVTLSSTSLPGDQGQASTPLTFTEDRGDPNDSVDLTLTDAAGDRLVDGGGQGGTGVIYVPDGTPAGTYSLSAATILTFAGQRVVVPPDTIAALAPSVRLTVTGAVPASDTTAPRIVSSAVSPTSVDVSTVAARLSVVVHVTDVGRGVSSLSGRLTNPAGGTAPIASFQRVDGDVLDGTWLGLTSLPVGAPTGTWTLSHLIATDAAGNLSTADPSPAAVTVTATAASSVGPLLGGVRLAGDDFPEVDQVVLGAGNPGLHLTISDDVEGAVALHAVLHGPGGISRAVDDSGVGGQSDFGYDLPMTDADPSGTWTVDGFVLTDAVGRTSSPATSFTFTAVSKDVLPASVGTPLATISGTAVTATWTAPPAPPLSAISGYEVELLPEGTTQRVTATSATFASTSSASHTVLVRAVDDEGVGPVVTIAVTAAPAPPVVTPPVVAPPTVTPPVVVAPLPSWLLAALHASRVSHGTVTVTSKLGVAHATRVLLQGLVKGRWKTIGQLRYDAHKRLWTVKVHVGKASRLRLELPAGAGHATTDGRAIAV